MGRRRGGEGKEDGRGSGREGNGRKGNGMEWKGMEGNGGGIYNDKSFSV